MKKFTLDAYEQNLLKELEEADAAGLLKNTLTPAKAKMYQEAAARTLRHLRHERKSIGRPKHSDVTVTRSISMPLHKWEALDSKRGSLSRGKFIAAFV